MAPIHNELIAGTIQVYGQYYRFYNNGYTPRAAEASVLYSGNQPLALSYGNVEESFSLMITSEVSADECVAKKRALELALNTALFTTPCVLSLKAKEQTNTAYTEVYRAKIQEGPEFIGRESGAYVMRVSGMWTRAPFWGLLSNGETLLNAVSFQNQFSGSPDCFATFSAGLGDLIYEGSPLNLDITVTNGVTPWIGVNVIVSSYHSLISVASTQTKTTSLTTPQLSAAGDLISIGATVNANRGVNARLFAECSATDTDGSMRIKLFFQRSTNTATELSNPFYTSPWFKPFAAIGSFVDCGTIPIDMFRGAGITDCYAWLEIKSTSGTSTTYTLSNFYVLLYYTYAVIPMTSIGPMQLNQNDHLYIRGFDETTGRPCLPLSRARAYTKNSGGLQENYLSIYGSAPAYYSGASLMVAVPTIDSANLGSALTSAITAKHAPLWRTMRGNT
jgi:hypothetical protein